ncbi:uncharacterized protein LOC143618067 [Bidens hawaiensis]|uniref:uncharacterized protein LOC143618067 n=1 Tax=Bidens hawaiensis TaxID=980011 RepID=UPI00404A790F
MELRATNIDTTVKIEAEPCTDPTSDTRMFRRIYICLGPLKRGFNSGMGPILGLDGTFMKGNWPGKILTAVGSDANNGIYAVAYAVVESENTSSWTWFLECLGEDIGLGSNFNFTFISDKQKGIIPAIENLFPSAEHRYCVRHIHENMKQSWRGKLFKDLLYKAARATTVLEFAVVMEELKNTSQDVFKAIVFKTAKPPKPSMWFCGRFSLLTFERQLVECRDKPIITCLEYIREYIMRKIVKVQKVIQKSQGPLSPNATEKFKHIKTEASKCKVQWNGLHKFQRLCSCRRWELTGIPCKHAVASIWNVAVNGQPVGIEESWVDPVYMLYTWKEEGHNRRSCKEGQARSSGKGKGKTIGRGMTGKEKKAAKGNEKAGKLT